MEEWNTNTVIWSLENLEHIPVKDPKRTLFIIGNGFDLFHGVPSRYQDFRNWLERNGEIALIYELEGRLKSDSLWFDFERELGKLSVSQNLDLVSEGLDMFDVYNPDSQAADFYLAVEFATNTFGDFILSLRQAFSGWISSLTINSEYKPFKNVLSQESMYLTFNYTDFLETLYGIPEMNICYIHGSRKHRDASLIFGHSIDSGLDGDTRVPYSPYFKEQRKNQLIFDAQDIAIDYLSIYDQDITKNTYEVIASHRCFFHAQTWVKDIVVLGHSLSIIDYPYFNFLQDKLNNLEDVIWHITYYTEYDLERIWIFINNMGIDPNHVRLIQLNKDA